MRFTLPRDLYYGKDSIDILKTIKGKSTEPHTVKQQEGASIIGPEFMSARI